MIKASTPYHDEADYYKQAAAIYAQQSVSSSNSSSKPSQVYYCLPTNAETTSTSTTSLPHLLAPNTYAFSDSISSSPSKVYSEGFNTISGGLLNNLAGGTTRTSETLTHEGQSFVSSTLPSHELQKFDDQCAFLKTIEDSADSISVQKHFTSFLETYPLCFGYWRRWAILEMKLTGDLKLADEIFLQGLKFNPYCVELWIARIELYQNEGKRVDEDYFLAREDEKQKNKNYYTGSQLREIFEIGLNQIENEWTSGPFWRLYIEFELKNENWGPVGNLYYRVFSNEHIIEELPLLMKEFQEFLATYKNSFERLVHPDEMNDYNAMIEEVEEKEEFVKRGLQKRREEEERERQKRLRMLQKQFESRKQQLLERESRCSTTSSRKGSCSEEAMMKLEIEYKRDKAALIKELDEKVARHRKDEESDRQNRLTRQQKEILLRTREAGFQSSINLIEKRSPFEGAIRRRYFHPKPLDQSQLTAWREYLEFEIKESTCSAPNRVERLFRRCLVVCNSYVEFWNRYVDWLLDLRKDIEGARQLLARGRQIYLPGTIALWIKSAEVEECFEDLQNKLEGKDTRYLKAKKYWIEVDRLTNWSNSEIFFHRIAFERRHERFDICHQLFQSVLSVSRHKNNKCATKLGEDHEAPAGIFQNGEQPYRNDDYPMGDDAKACQSTASLQTDEPSHHEDGIQEPERRMNLSDTAKVKIAIYYAYFLCELEGNVEAARRVLKSVRELRCSRQSLLLASIDIETRAKAMKLGQRVKVMERSNSGDDEQGSKTKLLPDKDLQKDYIQKVSDLYEELLQEENLLNSELLFSLWHRYIAFLTTQGASIQIIKAAKVRALACLSELTK